MDIFGLVDIISIVKKKYALVIVDDFSRFTWTFFLASKDEASENIITLIKKLNTKTYWSVKNIRIDNGTEFKNSIMKTLCDQEGINQTFSAPTTPQ